MQFVIEIIAQTILLMVLGLIFSFIFWKLKKRRELFGEFFNKYGELWAYAGVFIIAIIIGLIQWWT